MDDPNNYLRLTKSLELTFDNKSITVIQENLELKLFVLVETFKRQPVLNTQYTSNDCHLWPLKFGNSSRPFLRLLVAHCRNSSIDAFRSKQINYETYQRRYRSSVAILNSLPEGPKAKIFDWFKRNDKMIKDENS